MSETTPMGPFTSVLVPYDGSEPSRSALELALALMPPAATLVLVTVVDETPIISESASIAVAFDPTSMFEALDTAGKEALARAVSRCAAENVTPVTELVHGMPLSTILAMIERHACDLVVMGTHARTGVPLMFLGSTTDGVLRASNVPVLTVRSTDPVSRHPFATALVGVDDSEASDAAVALAATLAQSFGTHIVACHAIDTTQLYANAESYAFDLEEILETMRSEGQAIVARSLAHTTITAEMTTVAIVAGSPATVLLETGQKHRSTVIVLGSHGRRGLRRFFLGSVAETVVRSSDLPVLVVRRPL